MRLNHYLASCGVCSRRRADQLILDGRVVVNKELVTELGVKVDPATDKVTVDGKPVSFETKKIFLFYKPKYVVSTLSDPQGRRSLTDFLREVRFRLFPVGRLDYDVSGLMILTNNGDYANINLHPRYEVRRRYLAMVEGEVLAETAKKTLLGVELEDGFSKIYSFKILNKRDRIVKKFFSDSQLKTSRRKYSDIEEVSYIDIEVAEGRKHLVKRIFKSIDHPVIELIRTEHGEFSLLEGVGSDLVEGDLVEIS